MSSDAAGKLSRRDFTRITAAAGLATLARASWAQGTGETLKVGLLGCGGRGTGAAMQMLHGNQNVQLVAMADVFEDRLAGSLKQLSENRDEAVRSKVKVDPEHRFVGLDAYKKILATDIDIVLEGSLPYCRPKHIEAAVEARKHIFTEKPVAVDPAGIRKIMAAAAKHKDMGLSFVAGTQRRHQKPYVDTIAKLHDGAIGDILAMRAYWCGGLPFAREREAGWSDLEYCIRNWYGFCWIAGDNIVEQHVHNLDVVNWVLKGHPEAVFASGGRTWKPREAKYGDIYDHFDCDYEYPGGVHVFSMSRHWNGVDGGVFEDAIGTKGRSNCADMGEGGEDPYVQEHIDLVNSIRGTGPRVHEGQQVAESTMTAIMGRMSAYTGMRLTWDQALKSDLSLVPDDLDFAKPYPLGPVPAPGSGS